MWHYISLVLLAAPGFVVAADWPHWRGPSRSGITDEESGWTGGPWLPEKPTWTADVGEGASTHYGSCCGSNAFNIAANDSGSARRSRPHRSPLSLPTVSVNDSSHFGPCRVSPNVARGLVTTERLSELTGAGRSSPAWATPVEPASAADVDAVPRNRRRLSAGPVSDLGNPHGNGESGSIVRGATHHYHDTIPGPRTSQLCGLGI